MRTSGKKKRGFDWFWIVLAVVIVYFSSVLVSQQMHLNQVSKSQAVADKRLSVAEQENARLKQEGADLNDLSHIERIAREELGMTKRGELPYSAAKQTRQEHVGSENIR